MMSTVLSSLGATVPLSPFLNYLHERDNYCLRDSLIGGARKDSHCRKLLREECNILFKEYALSSQTYTYTHRHWCLNMQICMFSLILGVYCQLEKKISNLKIKQSEAIQNVKSRGVAGGELQRILGLFSHFRVYSTK